MNRAQFALAIHIGRAQIVLSGNSQKPCSSLRTLTGLSHLGTG